MSKFLQEYYEQCKHKVNEYFEKYPYKTESMINQLLEDEFPSLYNINNIINKMGQKWYDEKMEEAQKKHEVDHMQYEDVFQAFRQGYLEPKREEHRRRLKTSGLDEVQKIKASKLIAVQKGIKIKGLGGKHVYNIECYLPRKIENLQIKKDDNTMHNAQDKRYNLNVTTESENAGSGCDCDNFCNSCRMF